MFGDVHVVGKVLSLLRRRATDRAASAGQVHDWPRRRQPAHRREHHRGNGGVGTTFTGHKDDVIGINNLLLKIKAERGLDIPLHVDGASGGFVWVILYPHSEWDFRLEQVRSINVSGHKFGLVYPGIGWLIFENSTSPKIWSKRTTWQDRCHFHAELLDRPRWFWRCITTSSATVGYSYIMKNMQENARVLAEKLESMGRFELIGPDEEQLPPVAFKLAGDNNYNEFDIAWQLSAERLDGAGVHASPERPGRHDHARLVKETSRGSTLTRSRVTSRRPATLWPRRAELTSRSGRRS